MAMLVRHREGSPARWEPFRELEQLQEQIVQAVTCYAPDLIITFDEDGLYWHLDHIGVHERTVTAVKSFGTAAPPLYYVLLHAWMWLFGSGDVAVRSLSVLTSVGFVAVSLDSGQLVPWLQAHGSSSSPALVSSETEAVGSAAPSARCNRPAIWIRDGSPALQSISRVVTSGADGPSGNSTGTVTTR